MTAKSDEKRRADPGEVIAVIRRILAENGREYVWSYAAATVCLLAIAVTTAFGAWIMRDVIDEIFYRQRSELIVLICALIFGAFAVRGFASYGQAVILAKVGNNLVARYQQRLFDHLMRLGVDFHTSMRSGHLAAQINQNVAGIRELLGTTLKAVAGDVVTLLALIVVMVMQDPMLSILAFLIGPPLVYTVNRLMRRMRRITRDSVEVNSRLIGAMQEATQGIAVVKAFTMEEQLSRKIAALIKDAEWRNNKIARVSERLTPIAEILAGATVALVVGYAGYRTAYHQQLPGAVFSFISALLLAYDPARRLARVQVNLERALVNARMIYEILDLKPRQRDVARRQAPPGIGGPSSLRGCAFRLQRRFARASRRELHRRGGQDDGHRRRFGGRQVDADGSSRTFLRRRGRRDRDRWPEHRQGDEAVAARSDRLRFAAALPFRRHDRRQYPLRPGERDGRGGPPGRAARRRRTSSSGNSRKAMTRWSARMA